MRRFVLPKIDNATLSKAELSRRGALARLAQLQQQPRPVTIKRYSWETDK